MKPATLLWKIPENWIKRTHFVQNWLLHSCVLLGLSLLVVEPVGFEYLEYRAWNAIIFGGAKCGMGKALHCHRTQFFLHFLSTLLFNNAPNPSKGQNLKYNMDFRAFSKKNNMDFRAFSNRTFCSKSFTFYLCAEIQIRHSLTCYTKKRVYGVFVFAMNAAMLHDSPISCMHKRFCSGLIPF